MMNDSVEVIRRFAPLPSITSEWSLHLTPTGRSRRWYEIEHELRLLILADPGAGKTFEARIRAQRLREKGKKAFFIRIEAVNATFEDSFEIGTADEFRLWLTSNEEAWFFLDSVDEAQLSTPRALERAIRFFGEKIYAARERAHVTITSRVEAWRALPDQELIEKYLPCGAPDEEKADGTKGEPKLKPFRLEGLSRDEIEHFSSAYGVGDIPAFVDEINRCGLMELAVKPFDLKALIAKWNADQTLGSRYIVIQRMIEIQLKALSSQTTTQKVLAEKARVGARALAAAVTLTGQATISLPEGVVHPDRIDPRQLLPDWGEAEIDALLRSGIFDDVVYSSVRFRHREIRELLSAEWFFELANQPGGRPYVESLFIRESYQELVIVPRTRPILPWLILLDEGIRDRVIAIAPEVASEGGDPSRLPLEIRQILLAQITERIATQRD